MPSIAADALILGNGVERMIGATRDDVGGGGGGGGGGSGSGSGSG